MTPAKRSTKFFRKEWATRNRLFAHGVMTVAVHQFTNLFWNGLYFAEI